MNLIDEEMIRDIELVWIVIFGFCVFAILAISFPIWMIPYEIYKWRKSK